MATSKKASSKSAYRSKRPATKSSGGRNVIKLPKLIDDLYNLEIYIKYTKLDNSTWVYILRQIEFLKTSIIKEFELENELTNQLNSKVKLVPTLDISLIHTGQSVIIRFKEGWRPKFKLKNNNITIEVPKHVAIPGLILYSLIRGYDLYLDIQNKRIDNLLKKIELEEKLNSIGKTVDDHQVSQKTVDFIKNINNNIEIKYFRVNNLIIKNDKE